MSWFGIVKDLKAPPARVLARTRELVASPRPRARSSAFGPWRDLEPERGSAWRASAWTMTCKRVMRSVDEFGGRRGRREVQDRPSRQREQPVAAVVGVEGAATDDRSRSGRGVETESRSTRWATGNPCGSARSGAVRIPGARRPHRAVVEGCGDARELSTTSAGSGRQGRDVGGRRWTRSGASRGSPPPRAARARDDEASGRATRGGRGRRGRATRGSRGRRW